MNRILKPAEWAAIKAIVPRPNNYRIADFYHCKPSGTIVRVGEKPMSRRDRIRAKLQPKNRFTTTTKEPCHA